MSAMARQLIVTSPANLFRAIVLPFALSLYRIGHWSLYTSVFASAIVNCLAHVLRVKSSELL